jgi:SAM-dependent methyltransferase
MNWHERYTQQAGWTADLRAYLFKQVGLFTGRCTLEVGCGTGAILSEMRASVELHGLDLSRPALIEAHRHAPYALLTCGDALHLPYPDGRFEITCCHYLLLWVADPLQVLQEMKRVTRRGGHLLAMAEPHYDARLDEPAELAELGRLQTRSLVAQGADPDLGERLAGLFVQAGITIVETGVIEHQPKGGFDPVSWELEWAVLESDLTGYLPGSKIQEYKNRDRAAWERGERVLHVPTHFAWGRA